MAEPRFDTFMINNPVIIKGNISNLLITDLDGDPNLVLDVDSKFLVHVDWSLTGLLQPALGGEWHLHIYAESIGPGADAVLYDTVIPLNPAVQNYHFVTPQLTMPTGTDGNVLDGTYQLSAILTHTHSGIRTHMAGFIEGPMVQFYRAP